MYLCLRGGYSVKLGSGASLAALEGVALPVPLEGVLGFAPGLPHAAMGPSL